MIQTSLHIRWMIRRDMREVLAIEAEAFRYPWDEHDFVRCLRQRNCIGMVAEHENLIAGYMVYDLERTRIGIVNFAVDRSFRRQGVGRQMIEKLKAKLSDQRRKRIVVNTADWNLDAHLFFRAMGFRAVAIEHDRFQPSADSYRFVFRHSAHGGAETRIPEKRRSGKGR